MKTIDTIREQYPDKFAPEKAIFGHIHRGDRIFVGTGCGEPQYLVQALVQYVEENPGRVYDAEVVHVWTLGVAPYTDEKFKRNFRHNAFFIGQNTREAVNRGMADYTPVFLSKIPELLYTGAVPIDVALIQVSSPDAHGYVSLGVSVDIVKAAVESADLVIAQVNRFMPRIHGNCFVHIRDIDFLVCHDESLLEYQPSISDEVSQRIGKYVSRLVDDEATIQVGYGRLPNAILSNLHDKKHLGVHTELLTEGVVQLMREGVVDNSRKTINADKTVATFCMSTSDTYEFLHDNPAIEFHPVEYTNNPLVIAQHRRMTAINTALEIDLTGQSTAESLGETFFSGIGGQADFMRGAVLAPQGKTILALPSTANNEQVSRIVPFMQAGAGTTLIRGDIQYVVTEYGIAYLPGKNIRERAMALIEIAHPKFRMQLLKEAKRHHLIYRDQAFIPGQRGQYQEDLELKRTTKKDLSILLRPVKVSDESLLKDFFYSLSDQSLYRRFISRRMDMPHERLQEFVVVDTSRGMIILATIGDREEVIGLGQYGIDDLTYTAEIALVVRDDYQGHGIGTELVSYLTYLAKKQGLRGFTAEVLKDNRPMLHLFEKRGFTREKEPDSDVYRLQLQFK